MAITEEPSASARQHVQVTASGISPPQVSGHENSLDGLRVIAALAVIVTHVAAVTGLDLTGSPVSWATSRGDVGVPIFFTLSGLLLFRPWVVSALATGQRPAVGKYLIRRALRILPAYWIVVFVAIITLDTAHAGSVSAWAQYLLLIQVYNAHPWWLGTGAAGLAQMWSLAVEVSFYAVLPVLGMALAWLSGIGTANVAVRARRMLIAIAVLAGFSYAFMAIAYYPAAALWLNGTLPRMLTWFAPGMALAVITVWARQQGDASARVREWCQVIASAGSACWLIAAFVFLIACTPVAGPETLQVPSLWAVEIRTALYAVIAAAIVAPAAFQPARRTPMNSVLGNPVMRFLGRISYGVFLWQYVAIYAIFGLFGIKDAYHGGSFTFLGSVVVFVAVSAVSCGLATISYYLVERPAQQFYRTRQHGRHERPVTTPVAGDPGRA